MTAWQGKRTIAVVTACMTAHGTPCFALNTVEVTYDEYGNGSHYALAEIRLVAQGYEEPFVHFFCGDGDYVVPAWGDPDNEAEALLNAT
jgi:hypothetical protein